MKSALLILLMLPLVLLGQYEDNLFIEGFTFIPNDSISTGVSSVSVDIKQGRHHYISKSSDQEGAFEAGLSLGHVYTIQVSKKGYYTKSVVIDLTGIPASEAEGGFLMELRFSLVADTNKKDRRLLKKKPIGKCSFDPDKNSLEWDFEYTESILSKLHD